MFTTDLGLRKTAEYIRVEKLRIFGSRLTVDAVIRYHIRDRSLFSGGGGGGEGH